MMTGITSVPQTLLWISGAGALNLISGIWSELAEVMTGRILHQDVVKQYAYYAQHRDSVIHLTISNQKIEGLLYNSRRHTGREQSGRGIVEL